MRQKPRTRPSIPRRLRHVTCPDYEIEALVAEHIELGAKLLARRSSGRLRRSADYRIAVPDITSRTTISATPEQVFDFIDHWPNAMRYLKRMVRWDPVDPDNTGVGGVFHVAVQAGPTRLNGRLEVTKRERPTTIAFRSIEGARVEGSWTITPSEDGTLVVLHSYYEPPGGIIGRVVAAFIRQNAQHDLDASLRELKRLVESS